MLLLDDGQTESFFYIMLGQDADDFVHRCGSLRVARDRGAVERLTYDDSGELFWVQD